MGKGVRDGVNISGLLINVYVVAIICAPLFAVDCSQLAPSTSRPQWTALTDHATHTCQTRRMRIENAGLFFPLCAQARGSLPFHALPDTCRFAAVFCKCSDLLTWVHAADSTKSHKNTNKR